MMDSTELEIIKGKSKDLTDYLNKLVAQDEIKNKIIDEDKVVE